MAFTRNWDRTVVAKVISDRHVIPAQFSQLMLRVWGVHTGTQITVIGVNTFLIVFFFLCGGDGKGAQKGSMVILTRSDCYTKGEMLVRGVG